METSVAGRVGQPELVQVVVEPTHRILDGDVQVPERVGLGHLNAPPHERVGPLEHDQELVTPVGLLPRLVTRLRIDWTLAMASPTGRRPTKRSRRAPRPAGVPAGSLRPIP